VLSLIVAAPFFIFALRHLDLPFYGWSKLHPFWAVALTLTLLQSWVPQGALTWNSVCWSLSVEAFFYFVFPFFLLRTKKLSPRGLILALLGFWAASLTLSLSYILFHPDGPANVDSVSTTLFFKNFLSFNPLVRLPEFLIGMMAGRLFLGEIAGQNASRKFATPLIGAGLAAFAAVVAFSNTIPTPVMSAGLLSPAFAAIIFGTAQQPRWLAFLANPLLVLLGDASYSLYLLHSLIITRTFNSLTALPHLFRVAGALAAALVASLVAFKIVEEPARRRLRPRRKPLVPSDAH